MQKIAVIIFSTALFASCKKEEAAFPYNNIERFSIQAPDGSTLKASISGNEIIVYWPPLVNMPDSVTPQIEVSERAKVHPASGTKLPFKDGVSFTVSAENGTAKIYILRAGSNQPMPVFEVASPDFLRIGNSIDLVGEYFIKDTAKTKVFLINNKSGAQTQLPGISFTTFYSARISAPLPFTIDTGSCNVKLISGVRTVTQGPYKIDKPFLTVVSITDAGLNRKPGETSLITYGGDAAKYYHDLLGNSKAVLTVQSVNGNEFVTVNLTKSENGQLYFVIPDKAPGKIIHLSVQDVAGNILFVWESQPGKEINIITQE